MVGKLHSRQFRRPITHFGAQPRQHLLYRLNLSLTPTITANAPCGSDWYQ
jgi:hypothetical protein